MRWLSWILKVMLLHHFFLGWSRDSTIVFKDDNKYFMSSYNCLLRIKEVEISICLFKILICFCLLNGMEQVKRRIQFMDTHVDLIISLVGINPHLYSTEFPKIIRKCTKILKSYNLTFVYH